MPEKRLPSAPQKPRWGRFEIDGWLGGGRFSSVYQAHDERGIVALKVASGAGARLHLEHEATLLQRLSHPNLVSLLEIVDGPDGFALVLPVVEGMSLRHWIETQTDRIEQRIGDVLEVGLQLAEVVRYLSERGLPHGDLKPENVQIQPETRRVTLLDLGLGGDARGGTPLYLPPDAGPRDTWALGCILFEMVFGQTPAERFHKGIPEPDALWDGATWPLPSALFQMNGGLPMCATCPMMRTCPHNYWHSARHICSRVYPQARRKRTVVCALLRMLRNHVLVPQRLADLVEPLRHLLRVVPPRYREPEVWEWMGGTEQTAVAWHYVRQQTRWMPGSWEDRRYVGLRSVLRRTPSEAVRLGLQLLELVPHGALRPELVLIDGDRLKLIPSDGTGPAAYRAPETFRGSVHEKSDVWSIGVMLYEAITGQTPLSTLLPPQYLARTSRRFAPHRLLSRLPAEVFYEEEQRGCDGCRGIVWDVEPTDGGMPCAGVSCRPGDFPVLNFKLPMPLALYLKNHVLVPLRRRASGAEFAAFLTRWRDVPDSEWTRHLWLPSQTLFHLRFMQRAPHDEQLQTLDAAEVPSDAIAAFPLLPHILAWLADTRAEPADVAEAHVTVARYLACARAWKTAVHHYEAAVKVYPDHGAGWEELILLCAQIDLRRRAEVHYRAFVRRLKGTPPPWLGTIRSYLLARKLRSGDGSAYESEVQENYS